MGYTAARMDGGGSFGNSIFDGTAKFCRASSFSIDSELSSIDNCKSYHNSYQVGFNFGHAGAPAHNSTGTDIKAINAGWKGGTGGTSYGISVVAGSKNVQLTAIGSVGAGRAGLNVSDSSTGSNLAAINAGWSGGLSGSSYGLNIVAGSKNVQLDTISSVGAGRAGLNVSDSATGAVINGGNIRYSAAQGVNAFRASILLTGVKATNNVSGDFVANTDDPLFPSLLNLSNCEDSNGTISSQQIDTNTVARTFNYTSRFGKCFGAYRAVFETPASTPIATIFFADNPDDDNMLVTTTYGERNTASATGSQQFTIEETVLVSGSAGARTIDVQNTPYSQIVGFRYAWTGSNTFEVYLQASAVDIVASPENNFLELTAKSVAESSMHLDIGIDL